VVAQPIEASLPQQESPSLATPRPRFAGLQLKLILPYVLLTLLVAAVGTYIVTRLVSGSVRERFYNNLTNSSNAVSTGIVQREADHLDRLRRLAFIVGVAQALENSDSVVLQGLLTPEVLNDRIEAVTLVNREGTEVLSLILNADEQSVSTSSGVDLSKEVLVQNVLAGRQDAQGDKFAGVRTLGGGSYLFASSPVVDEAGNLVGAILIGSRLDHLLATLRDQALAQEAVAFDRSGNAIARTFLDPVEGMAALTPSTSEIEVLTAEPLSTDEARSLLRPPVNLNGVSYEFLYTPFIIRGEPVGVLGVALRSDYVVNTEVASRQQFAIVFTFATLGVIGLGYFLARNMANPILKLRGVARAVAGGDLQQKTDVRRNDEIGELAQAFDVMTDNLRARTDQANRLFWETQQRNQELADINTRLQNTQEQLVQSEKLASVGQLTAGIVHDVKNPLAVIKGLAEILQEENLDDFAREQLTLIRDNASRANNIVSDLLTFARQSTPEMSARDLRETVQAALRLTEYLVRRAHVNASLELPAEPVFVEYDAQQIEQVLINLIQNAVQAMPSGGNLLLSLAGVDGHALLRIRDSGVGIAPENLRRIFDPFFTTKAESDGTGLGLSVSYGILTRHHGDIRVESVVGQGTTFTIILPAAQPDLESEAKH
jgi:signal transduction histidine kinase